MVKGLIHPPAGYTDTSWTTHPSQRASAKSRILLIPCLDETMAHWFLIVIVALDIGQK